MDIREIRHFHLFCGLGGGARGFNAAQVRMGQMHARFRCLGGVDVDAAAIRDFERLAGVPGTVLDMFDREQFLAFHGAEPPAGWREATPDDIRTAAGGERPHIVFLSAPCKGFSGLLPEARSGTARYQALNRLTLRGVFLMLEAWVDDPPELVIFENVPRITSRGRPLLDRIGALLRSYGYAVAETEHDCGEIGGLAQSRKRFLLVARHQAKVPPFLYEPPRHKLRAVGEVLDRLPVPGDTGTAGPMHRIPALQWRTWVRLAFVEAGSDWRSLARLKVEDGLLRDFRLVPDREWHKGVLGVRRWDETTGTVAGESLPANGAVAVADPRRAEGRAEYGQYGVKDWSDTSQAVIGKAAVGAGNFSVADPRHGGPARFNNVYRVVPWTEASGTVTGGQTPTSGGLAVADPRPAEGRHPSKYRVTRADEAAGVVISASTTGDGAFAVADPRTGWGPGAHTSKLAVMEAERPARTVTGSDRVGSGAMCVADPRWHETRDAYQSGGHYGVLRWQDTAGAVASASQHDNGRWSVADPRPNVLPAADERLVAMIVSTDGTWHRPFTTLELAALQSLADPEEKLALDGLSDSAWRERIGNAVPPAAARAIAETMGRTLLLAWSGEGFLLSNVPIWVRDVAVALSVREAA